MALALNHARPTLLLFLLRRFVFGANSVSLRLLFHAHFRPDPNRMNGGSVARPAARSSSTQRARQVLQSADGEATGPARRCSRAFRGRPRYVRRSARARVFLLVSRRLRNSIIRSITDAPHAASAARCAIRASRRATPIHLRRVSGVGSLFASHLAHPPA